MEQKSNQTKHILNSDLIGMKQIFLIFFTLTIFSQCSQQKPSYREDGFIRTEDEVALYYQRVGTGAEVVIIPAGMYLADEFNQLHNNTRMIIFYDQRGRGHSSTIDDTNKLGIEYEIADLEAVRNYFQFEQISLIGWSYAGAIAAVYAIKYPQYVKRVIQIGSIPPCKQDFWEKSVRTKSSRLGEEEKKEIDAVYKNYSGSNDTGEFIKQFYQIAHRPIFYGEVIENKFRDDFYELENERPDNVWKFILPAIIKSMGDWDFRDKLKQIKIPFLTIHGTYDPIPTASAEEWSRTLPNGRLLVIEDAGHFPWLEKPEQFYIAVDQFLSGSWPNNAIIVQNQNFDTEKYDP